MSLKASVEGLKKANLAFKTKGKTQEYVAGSIGCTRQVIGKFLNGKAIALGLFKSICAELDLPWEEVVDLEAELQQPIHDSEIDALVQDVRSKVNASIQKRCGTMRVLDMTQPITIDSIYTSVNILEKISRNQRRSIEELMGGCEVEDFNRFTLHTIRQDRIPALKAVQSHDKLIILGKPGAGKTTFLKWLALQCNGSEFNKKRVPIFVTLKEFAEVEKQPNLLGFIVNQLTECGVKNGKEVGAKILLAGRAIVLLDGLDEVKPQDHDRVINTIRDTTQYFDGNQFVMTCRIAAKEYVFEKFTEVEIADFDDWQIADFADKWFKLKDPVKAKEFPRELEADPRLQELATNPLLLTLLCLVFEEGGRFPSNRSELYKEGLDILLKKWDAKRNIRREEVYKQLSLQRKEDLLSQVAYKAFEQSDYFFKKRFVEDQIQNYIRNLPNASIDPEALQLDSEAVLNSIAAQHGLLVERARGIYSFSHLTFQEYFTARWFKEKADGDFGELIKHVTDPQWREVLLLTVGMLKNADQLLQCMKHKIDSILAQNKKIQDFLTWIEQKALSLNTSYKISTVRAFYFELVCSTNYDDEDNYLSFFINPSGGYALQFNLARDIDNKFAIDIEHDLNSETNPIYHEDISPEVYGDKLKNFLNRHRKLDPELDLDLHLKLYCESDGFLPYDFQYTISISQDIQLQESLKNLENQLSLIRSINRMNYDECWYGKGKEWTAQLRIIAIKYRDICHEFKFSEAQLKMLQIYCEANRFLIECLNSDCYISREVKEGIENNLLLPIKSC